MRATQKKIQFIIFFISPYYARNNVDIVDEISFPCIFSL